jgi:peptidoglycan/LPS O-acetylase OafA/YrhL
MLQPASRNHLLDLFRILFATLVLLSHSYEFVDGNRSRELFARLTHTSMSFGEVGVAGFFLLSGYLIVRSWQHDPNIASYLQKRILRIVPGYLVAAILSTLVIGLLVPGVPHFFRHLRLHYIFSVALLSSPVTPVVFPGTIFDLVDGAMWTIPYEFRCYLLVAILGSLGIFRRNLLWFALTVVLLAAMSIPAARNLHTLRHGELLLGRTFDDFRMTAAFFVGGCFQLFRDRIRFRPWMALIAVFLFLLVDRYSPAEIETAVTVCGGYLLFYTAHTFAHSLAWARKLPDISYGIYLYGWPVLGLAVWYLHGWPVLLLFALSTVVSFALGFVSWHVVERPMLQFKKHATARLTP